MKTNIEVRYAAHPDDVKHWDTDRLRREHFLGTLFRDNAVTMVPLSLQTGFHRLADGEEFYFISNPATGLWKAAK